MTARAPALLLLAALGCTTTTRAQRGPRRRTGWHATTRQTSRRRWSRTIRRGRHGLGILDGSVLGLGAGVLFGLIYGATRPLSPYERSMDCTIVCNHGDAAKLGALMFGALGLVVGAATGAAVGARDELDLR
jgi:hypothetical protein